MLSVLVYTPAFPSKSHPYQGIFVKEQLCALRHYLGYSFTVVAPQGKAGLSLKQRAEREDGNGVSVYRPLYCYPPIPKVTVPFRGWMMLNASRPFFRAEFHKQQFNLAHVHFAYPGGGSIGYLKRNFNIPVVLTVHGSDIFRYPRHFVLRGQVKRALQLADHIICVSSALQEAVLELVSRPPDTISVIPNGVNPLDFVTAQKDGGDKDGSMEVRQLLYVGNLNYTKGIDVLIRAMALLPNVRTVHLTIVGNGRIRSELERLGGELGLQDNIRFVGGVPHAEVIKWMARSDLLIVPSRTEGFGIVAIEAMAAGLPVVASDVGGLRETVQPETGILCEPNNAKALAEAIRRALERRWMLSEIRNRAARYDWPVVVREIRLVYQSLLEPEKSSAGSPHSELFSNAL